MGVKSFYFPNDVVDLGKYFVPTIFESTLAFRPKLSLRALYTNLLEPAARLGKRREDPPALAFPSYHYGEGEAIISIGFWVSNAKCTNFGSDWPRMALAQESLFSTTSCRGNPSG